MIGIFDPRVMDEVVSVLPPVNMFLRDTFFTRRRSIEGIKADVDFFKGSRRLAPFVHPNGPAATVDKHGYETNSFVTPDIKMKDVTDNAQLEVRVMGEPLQNSGMTKADRAIQKMAETLQDFNDMISRREEWMCSQALFTGKIPVKGVGVDYIIDFKFTNKATCGTTSGYGPAWSNKDSATPINDIDTAISTAKKKGYRRPNIAIMSRDAYGEFIACQSVLDVLDLKNMTLAVLAPSVISDSVTYGGTIPYLGLSIYIYEDWYYDLDTKTDKPVVPDGTVLLASTTAKFSIFYGEMLLADETAQGGLRSVIGERAAETWVQKDPVARFLALQSRPITAPQEVDSWVVLTV